MTRYLPLVLLAAPLLVGAPGAEEKLPVVEAFSQGKDLIGRTVAEVTSEQNRQAGRIAPWRTRP